MKFTGLYVVQLPSEAYKLKRAISEIKWSKVDGIVIKHSTLRSDVFSKWIAQNLNSDGGCNIFDTFFLDESSVIKNVETKIATYTKNICNVCKRVHFMNATVFETNIMDIYNQMDMLVPDLLLCQSISSSFTISLILLSSSKLLSTSSMGKLKIIFFNPGL